jgi:hypothetical protein
VGNLIKAQYIQAWSTKAKPPWAINRYSKKKKNEDQGDEIGLFQGWIPVRVGGNKKRVKI